jgi:NAD(P)-dependent dehydrogenase (short-subunit alcohol dehydrogenase family)
MTVALAAETEGMGIAVNALTPQAAVLTPELAKLRDSGDMDADFFEPMETLVEAAMALCTTQNADLHGRVAYSLELLLELGRPTRNLAGANLVPNWQPVDLPAQLRRQLGAHERAGGGQGQEAARLAAALTRELSK